MCLSGSESGSSGTRKNLTINCTHNKGAEHPKIDLLILFSVGMSEDKDIVRDAALFIVVASYSHHYYISLPFRQVLISHHEVCNSTKFFRKSLYSFPW